MSNEPLIALENRFAWLERHVTEQDKAMLKLEDEMRRLKRKMEQLQERTPTRGQTEEPPEANERPPHY
jgi:SlyX protein